MVSLTTLWLDLEISETESPKLNFFLQDINGPEDLWIRRIQSLLPFLMEATSCYCYIYSSVQKKQSERLWKNNKCFLQFSKVVSIMDFHYFCSSNSPEHITIKFECILVLSIINFCFCFCFCSATKSPYFISFHSIKLIAEINPDGEEWTWEKTVLRDRASFGTRSTIIRLWIENCLFRLMSLQLNRS